jgi:predicted protein tyrosine phosphatase
MPSVLDSHAVQRFLFVVPYATPFLTAAWLLADLFFSRGQNKNGEFAAAEWLAFAVAGANLSLLALFLASQNLLSNHQFKMTTLPINSISCILFAGLGEWKLAAIPLISNIFPAGLSMFAVLSSPFSNAIATPNGHSASSIASETAIEFVVGNFQAGKSSESLLRHGVSHIIEIHDGKRMNPETPPDACQHIQKIQLELSDDAFSTQEAQFFSVLDAAEQFVTARNAAKTKIVFVHCTVGVSRSAAVASALLAKNRGLRLGDAVAMVKASRPIVDINRLHLETVAKWLAGARPQGERLGKKGR